jgi:TolA-binding protein
MSSIWAKIAAAAVIILAIIIGLSFLPGDKSTKHQTQEPEKQQKTFSDVIEEDDKRLRAAPEPQRSAEENTEKDASTSENKPQPKQFTELTDTQQVEAQRLFEYAINQRKMARLPGTGYGQMVESCRKIIKKFPNSEYAYKARRMLGEVPKRYWSRYKLTEEEIYGEK